MNAQNGYRQGDLAYISVESFPEGVEASGSNVILQSGSGGNPHSFAGGEFYKREEGDFILGYLKAAGTKLFHAEHGPKEGFALPDGLYQVRRQNEETIDGLKQVQD